MEVQAGLGVVQVSLAAPPTSMQESQNGCQLAGLSCNTCWLVSGLGISYVRLEYSISWQVQDLGLGMVLVGEQAVPAGD